MESTKSSVMIPFENLKTHFIYFFETERDRVRSGEGQREREGDRESEAGFWLQAVSTEPDAGLEPMNREIMT